MRFKKIRHMFVPENVHSFNELSLHSRNRFLNGSDGLNEGRSYMLILFLAEKQHLEFRRLQPMLKFEFRLSL